MNMREIIMDNYNKMRNLFESASTKFLIEQKNLIQSEVSERTLCGQLMLYLNEEKKDSIQSILC